MPTRSLSQITCLQTILHRPKPVSTGRPKLVPTDKPKVPEPVPTGRQNRPFPVPTGRRYSPSVTSGCGLRWANAVKPSAGCSWKTHRKGLYWENPYSDAEDEGIFDSCCSRSMTVPPGSIPVPTGSITIPSSGTMISPGNGIPIPIGSPTDSFFDNEPATRFPSPSNLRNNEPSHGIFSSSSYDDEFGADLNNLASTVEVSPVATKRINTIHPQSLIIGDHTSAVQTRSKVNKTPTDKYAIGTKWILKNKRDARGLSVRTRQLVAQGHRLVEGIDYDELFAPCKNIVIRLFLAFWLLTWIYGFVDPQHSQERSSVSKLYMDFIQTKACTKEISSWYKSMWMTSFLDLQRRPGGYKFEALMKGEFEISAIGELTFFLGLQVQQRPDGIFINQDKYVQEILNKFDLEYVRTTTTPYEAPKPNLQSVLCSRNQVTPTTSNLEAVKKIFKYLKGQPKLGLWYPRESPFVLEAYSDSDYAGANKDRKSTTGGCQFLGRRLISWQCKKQTIVATSSTEAEYVAAANCCGQVYHIVVNIGCSTIDTMNEGGFESRGGLL
ncbi:putative ribonuclease H-like domain-containing protein [Tanacetum coccineum]